MTARFLAWYTYGVLALASLLLLFACVGPGAATRFAVLQASLGGAALFFAIIAAVLTQLPREHWGHRSFAVRCSLVVAAVIASMLVATSVG
jgi:hypothetical protein